MSQASNPTYTDSCQTANSPVYSSLQDTLKRKKNAIMGYLVSNCTAFIGQETRQSQERIMRCAQTVISHSMTELRAIISNNIFALIRSFKDPQNNPTPDESCSSNPPPSSLEHREQKVVRFFRRNCYLIIYQLTPTQREALRVQIERNSIDEDRTEQFHQNTLSLVELFA